MKDEFAKGFVKDVLFTPGHMKVSYGWNVMSCHDMNDARCLVCHMHVVRRVFVVKPHYQWQGIPHVQILPNLWMLCLIVVIVI